LGINSVASGLTSIALGDNTQATNEDSVAIGDQAQATAFHSTAVGGESIASGAGAQAFGWRADALGAQSVAVGNQTQATGNASAALGNLAQATGLNSTALGNSAVATATNTTALGQNSHATAAGASAIGAQANATFVGSTAIGAGANTTAANQVTLGGGGSSVRIGDAAASTAAQDAASTNIATMDVNGVFGRSNINIASLGALQNSFASVQGQVSQLFDLANRNHKDIREADEGVAMALALDTPSIPAGAHFAVSGGVGYFKGQGALATAISAAVSKETEVSAGVTYGFNSNNVGARAGFQFAF
jgi:autotransporter adhesin